ncbi:16678_t:CDS:2, partial [Gigaspora rosea]
MRIDEQNTIATDNVKYEERINSKEFCDNMRSPTRPLQVSFYENPPKGSPNKGSPNEGSPNE